MMRSRQPRGPFLAIAAAAARRSRWRSARWPTCCAVGPRAARPGQWRPSSVSRCRMPTWSLARAGRRVAGWGSPPRCTRWARCRSSARATASAAVDGAVEAAEHRAATDRADPAQGVSAVPGGAAGLHPQRVRQVQPPSIRTEFKSQRQLRPSSGSAHYRQHGQGRRAGGAAQGRGRRGALARAKALVKRLANPALEVPVRGRSGRYPVSLDIHQDRI